MNRESAINGTENVIVVTYLKINDALIINIVTKFSSASTEKSHKSFMTQNK